MTSVEIPVSIAAALPNLTVLDITNDVRREVAPQISKRIFPEVPGFQSPAT